MGQQDIEKTNRHDKALEKSAQSATVPTEESESIPDSVGQSRKKPSRYLEEWIGIAIVIIAVAIAILVLR